MERLARPLVILSWIVALGLPGGAASHPGHDEPIPWCAPVSPEASASAAPAIALAWTALARGVPAQAVRMIAEEAEHSAAAALVLADALEALGDPEGASIARLRAAALGRLAPSL